MANETNVTNIRDEDKNFVKALVGLSPEKKTLLKGILIGFGMQEKAKTNRTAR